MTRKGQITVFIIVGLLLLIGVFITTTIIFSKQRVEDPTGAAMPFQRGVVEQSIASEVEGFLLPIMRGYVYSYTSDNRHFPVNALFEPPEVPDVITVASGIIFDEIPTMDYITSGPAASAELRKEIEQRIQDLNFQYLDTSYGCKVDVASASVASTLTTRGNHVKVLFDVRCPDTDFTSRVEVTLPLDFLHYEEFIGTAEEIAKRYERGQEIPNWYYDRYYETGNGLKLNIREFGNIAVFDLVREEYPPAVFTFRAER